MAKRKQARKKGKPKARVLHGDFNQGEKDKLKNPRDPHKPARRPTKRGTR